MAFDICRVVNKRKICHWALSNLRLLRFVEVITQKFKGDLRKGSESLYDD